MNDIEQNIYKYEETTNELTNFALFIDPQLNELLCIEQEFMTYSLLNQLKSESVDVFYIQAPTRKKAIENYLNSLEKNTNKNNRLN